MPKYYSNTTIANMSIPGVPNSAGIILTDIIQGCGIQYHLNSFIQNDLMAVEVNTANYNKKERCKLFQDKNIHYMTLPFNVQKQDIKDESNINENYEGKFYNRELEKWRI